MRCFWHLVSGSEVMPHLHREQLVHRSLPETFRFFEDARNLTKITPASLRLLVISCPDQVHAGAEITYTIRWMGLPLRWRTRITSYEPTHRFVDIQLRGPYKKWEHTHTFIAEGEDTRMLDDVEYELPFGQLGQLVAGWLIRRQLETIFAYRHDQVQQLLNR